MIVTLVGGTMLTLALTRPQLHWVRTLAGEHEHVRVWLERALTIFSFVMVGYAMTAVALVLINQLGGEADSLLEAAGAFLVVYGWVVHFDPFAKEWRLRRGIHAIVIYLLVTLVAGILGFFWALLALTLVHISVIGVVSVALAFAVVGGLCYAAEALLARRSKRLATRTPAPPTPASRPAAPR